MRPTAGPRTKPWFSSGAALAISAAVKLLKQVTKLAIYEAPYSLDAVERVVSGAAEARQAIESARKAAEA
jgi:hypothetical protein